MRYNRGSERAHQRRLLKFSWATYITSLSKPAQKLGNSRLPSNVNSTVTSNHTKRIYSVSPLKYFLKQVMRRQIYARSADQIQSWTDICWMSKGNYDFFKLIHPKSGKCLLTHPGDVGVRRRRLRNSHRRIWASWSEKSAGLRNRWCPQAGKRKNETWVRAVGMCLSHRL